VTRSQTANGFPKGEACGIAITPMATTVPFWVVPQVGQLAGVLQPLAKMADAVSAISIVDRMK
jgi:hypothetical protein